MCARSSAKSKNIHVFSRSRVKKKFTGLIIRISRHTYSGFIAIADPTILSERSRKKIEKYRHFRSSSSLKKLKKDRGNKCHRILFRSRWKPNLNTFCPSFFVISVIQSCSSEFRRQIFRKESLLAQISKDNNQKNYSRGKRQNLSKDGD